MAGPEGRGRPPWCAATCLRVLIVALGLARAQRADYCCRRLLWTPDWCLSPDCLGLGCAGKNAQAGFQCADSIYSPASNQTYCDDLKAEDLPRNNERSWSFYTSNIHSTLILLALTLWRFRTYSATARTACTYQWCR